jgi:Sec-independent protein translocase protein TatA
MDILGIGLQELFFILVIILLVARPKDIAGTARNLGKGLNRLYKSPNYQVIRKASHEIRNLPARLAREAQLEELEELKLAQQDLKEAAQSIGESTKPFQAWVEDVKPGSGAPPAGRTATPRAANGPRPASPTASRPVEANPEPASTPANRPVEANGEPASPPPSPPMEADGSPSALPPDAADDPGTGNT